MPRLAANLSMMYAEHAFYLRNLEAAARAAASAGVTIVIEPINPRDMPGFFLTRQGEAQAIRAEVGADNLRVQFDCYHCQVAGVPGRHEPDLGELNYPYLLALIDTLDYTGWVGCEYRPKGATSAGLAWARPYLAGGER